MIRKILYLLVPILLLHNIFAQSVICYNETSNVLVCNVTSTYVEEHYNNLYYLYKVILGNNIDTHYNNLYYLYKVMGAQKEDEHYNNLYYLYITLQGNNIDTHQNDLQYLYGSIQSSFTELHINPNITPHVINITPGHISILTDTVQIGDTEVPYIIYMPEYGYGYQYKVLCYINGTLLSTKVYTDVKPGSVLQDTCPVTIINKGLYNVTVEFYATYTAIKPPIEILLDTDSKLIRAVHSPFLLKIVSPKEDTYTTLKILVNYTIATPPTKGITYILESKIIVGNETKWSYNDTIPPGIVGYYTFNLSFNETGTYLLEAVLYALYHNTTLVDKVSDNVTFVITTQAVGGVGGTVPGAPPSTQQPPSQPPKLVEKPKLEVVQNITQIQKPEHVGVQSIIGYLTQRPWLIALVVLFIIILVIMLSQKQTIYVQSI